MWIEKESSRSNLPTTRAITPTTWTVSGSLSVPPGTTSPSPSRSWTCPGPSTARRRTTYKSEKPMQLASQTKYTRGLFTETLTFQSHLHLCNIVFNFFILLEDSYGTYCGSGSLAPIDTFGNEASLIFHSDSNDQEKTGFVINVNASVEGMKEKQIIKSSQHHLLLRMWRHRGRHFRCHSKSWISNRISSPAFV